ncbi:class I SAM-dependent methyltransferase [Leptospira sp. GIMC2001]|uniref:class I SAM-dependent methyltransferase n=1 Tax=Leptospira sp. GIMC2001 TaxID=1513297 RepID=UPI002349149D|nr:class I SAM-dependent methyltransferase [Leptospira sp. GIMC2001]WCL50278.1 class I SAM-dependent methyltransferase [Leptospira sp. GIMC2001]
MTEDSWLKRWNERYREIEYAYGEEPNDFLRSQLSKLQPGRILFPADGEGRNSVYAAKLGWNVSAFDISSEGKKKADQLAEKNQVIIDYQVCDIEKLKYNLEEFDAIALIYAHFPANLKSYYHKTLDKYLKTGGIIIFEAFSKKHIDYIKANEKVGGPRDIESLFSIEEMKQDFANYQILELEETEIELKEGQYHNGIGSVIRFIGMKK